GRIALDDLTQAAPLDEPVRSRSALKPSFSKKEALEKTKLHLSANTGSGEVERQALTVGFQHRRARPFAASGREPLWHGLPQMKPVASPSLKQMNARMAVALVRIIEMRRPESHPEGDAVSELDRRAGCVLDRPGVPYVDVIA